MSVRTFSARALANVVVSFGATPTDLAIVSSAHAEAVRAYYSRDAQACTAEEIEAIAEAIRSDPMTAMPRDEVLRMPGLLTYNARIQARDWTAEEPWASAFDRIDKAVRMKLREMRRAWEREDRARRAAQAGA